MHYRASRTEPENIGRIKWKQEKLVGMDGLKRTQ